MPSDGWHTLSDNPRVTSQPGQTLMTIHAEAQLEPLLTGSEATGMLDKKGGIRSTGSLAFLVGHCLLQIPQAPLLIQNFPHPNFNVR